MISNLSYLASFRLVLLNNLTRLALRKYETHQNRRKYLYSFGIPIVFSLIATTLSAMHSSLHIVQSIVRVRLPLQSTLMVLGMPGTEMIFFITLKSSNL